MGYQMDAKAAPNWIEGFPGLQTLSPDLLDVLVSRSRVIRLPASAQVFGPGMAPENYLMLIEGTIRVQQVSEGGREIVLYRVFAGESCALTTACLMGSEDYQAEGLVESNATAVAIPRNLFDDLMGRSQEFRQFVFTAFSKRITNLFHVIDEVAFARIDIRLAQRLLDLADAEGRLDMTHQQLASELGTAREVVSRQLHEFQRRGWIASSRGHIELSDRNGLSALAASA